MSFPLFAKLPPELQDRIWELCIPAPAAHLAELKLRTMVTHQGAMTGYRQHLYLVRNYVDSDLLSRNSPAVLKALLRTSPRACATVHRHLNAVAASEIERAFIREETPEAMTERVPPEYLPSIEIDASSDLVVLRHGWAGTVSHVVYNMAPRLLLEKPEQLRYLAVTWPSRVDELLHTCLLGLLTAFFELSVLYVMIEPEVLRESEKPWGNRHWNFSVSLEYSLDGFLAAYQGGRVKPGPFRCGKKEYFEIPVDHVARLGGLSDLISALELVRVKWLPSDTGMVFNGKELGKTREPMRVRLMSWRGTA